MVVVVTGASSGIGRATSLAFARRGARVAIAARRAGALQALARECAEAGGEALPLEADVTDESAVRTLAERTVERFGRIDVWVNNAGVALWGRLDEVPMDAAERVIQTNLLGAIHGARAALRVFRKQHGGILINVASMLGKMAVPYAAPYVASKFGIVGLGEALREETLGSGIAIVTIMPAAMDTPLFQHGANYTGRSITPPRPVYDAERVARAIVGAAEEPEREVFVGNAARALNVLHRLAPAAYEPVTRAFIDYEHFQDADAPPTAGNLFTPLPQHTSVSGGWRRPGRAARRALAIGAAGVAAAAVTWRYGRRSRRAA